MIVLLRGFFCVFQLGRSELLSLLLFFLFPSISLFPCFSFPRTKFLSGREGPLRGWDGARQAPLCPVPHECERPAGSAQTPSSVPAHRGCRAHQISETGSARPAGLAHLDR